MSAFPPFVDLCEVGPRDGFQFEAAFIPTDLKVEIIEGLAGAGLRRIQAVSFVHPARVPQMADAEKVIGSLIPRKGVAYTALVLNRKGLDRAAAAGLRTVDLSIAANETHSRANTGLSVEEGVAEAEAMIAAARSLGMDVQLGLQTVFGYASPGDTPIPLVIDMAARFADQGVESLSLADSTGMANPNMIRERIASVQRVAGSTPLVLHLHDTRGLGLANVVAALECGVTRFDSSLGGLGGCPFIPGATGNVATEDTAYLLESLGIETGVDYRKVAACSSRIAQFLGRPLSGKMYRLV